MVQRHAEYVTIPLKVFAWTKINLVSHLRSYTYILLSGVQYETVLLKMLFQPPVINVLYEKP